MSLRGSRKRRRQETTLELTPLIDVVFLLLIFFLITTTFSEAREAQIPIELPQAATGEEGRGGEAVTLVVSAEGEVELRGQPEARGETLEQKLAWVKENRPGAAVTLRGDEDASHGKVVELLALIREAGFEGVNVVIAEERGD